VVFWLAGASHVAEFPYGKKVNGNFFRKFISISSARFPDQYVATVAIFVERRKANAAVLVQIDSIEVQARTALKK